ncbi:MAG: helix-turn-helix protein [Chloroflexota bacterium]|jgi:transcriptional regulator with XRE-family HTH domain|nr:helix-turn-helix protein [Chloroflexota bacterium]
MGGRARQAAAAPALTERNAEGFREWLVNQLRARKMSQRQLAKKSGVDHSSISRLVRGDRVPSLHTAMRLAHSIDPTDQEAGGLRPGQGTGGSPTARVEYALRGDDRLLEADVREIMLYYLATRTGGPASPEPAAKGARPEPPVVTVARSADGPMPSLRLERRRTPRRS